MAQPLDNAVLGFDGPRRHKPGGCARHAGVRPGIYLSRVPGIQRLDLRVEGVNTDPRPSAALRDLPLCGVHSEAGVHQQGLHYGRCVGREGKGGQAWLTYHLSPQELMQISFRHQKNAYNFIPMGTTQNSFDLRLVKRIQDCVEVSAEVQREWWKAPVYEPGEQSDTVATFQITLHPERLEKTP